MTARPAGASRAAMGELLVDALKALQDLHEDLLRIDERLSAGLDHRRHGGRGSDGRSSRGVVAAIFNRLLYAPLGRLRAHRGLNRGEEALLFGREQIREVARVVHESVSISSRVETGLDA